MTKVRFIVYCGLAILIFVGCGWFLTVPIYREKAFICENTGSRKGHRIYCTGLQTRDWYQTSAVENYIQKNHPSEVKHRWTSYAGTGKNIFGQSVLFGHGRPGPIKGLPFDQSNEWFESLPVAEKESFYNLLVSGDEARIKARLELAWNELLDAR